MKSRTLNPLTLSRTKPIIVTLEYHWQTASMTGSTPYEIKKIVNEICITVDGRKFHAGDSLNESQANELLVEPNVEVVTIPSK